MRHNYYDNQSMHSCSEQECYGRSGFCDCDGDYEYDDNMTGSGDHAYTCGNGDPNNTKGTDRYARCGRYVNDNPDWTKRKAFRNILCNEVCKNYNCTYELYESDNCTSKTAFDNFILYGSTKYGDFPVQFTPNDKASTNPKECQYIPADDPSTQICPKAGKRTQAQDGAWRSIPQVCDDGFGPDGETGPWMFKSVKLKTKLGGSPKDCKITIFDQNDQAGNSLTVQYDPSLPEDSTGQCIKLDFSKGSPKPLNKENTKSAFSVESCYTTTCTKKYYKQEWEEVQNKYGKDKPQYRLAGRGVLWNDCVNFRSTYKEFCQDYGILQGKPMTPGEVCQLWDGAFTVLPDAEKISQNIIKNSTVKSEGLDKNFTCVIADVCNLPPTHVVQNEDFSVR